MSVPRPLVLAGAAGLGLSALLAVLRTGSGIPPRVELVTAWSVATPAVQSVIGAPVLPGRAHALVVEASGAVVLIGLDGRELRRRPAKGDVQTSATGDLDGDGVQEIVVATSWRAEFVTALDGATLAPRWTVASGKDDATPRRVLVADLDGDGRGEVVVAHDAGIVAFRRDGTPAWRMKAPAPGPAFEARGLGEIGAGKERLVVHVAREAGVRGLRGDGAVLWTRLAGRTVRRGRFLDGDGDGASEAHVGLEDGGYFVYPASGREEARPSLGEGVSEIRRAELDGDPKVAEVLLGGKSGAVRVMRGGSITVDTRVGGKISGLGSVDVDGDGSEELLAGTDDGRLHVLDRGGRVLAIRDGIGKVERILSVPAEGGSLAVVGAGPSVAALRLRLTPPPAWHGPVPALALAALAMALAFLPLRGLSRPRAPTASVPADPAAAARARVRSLVEKGLIGEDQAAERLAEIDRL